MYDFNRKVLRGWAPAIVVIAIMIVSLINSGSTSMSYSERQEQLLREQNNPLGYQDNEIVEKIIVDRGTNSVSYEHILEDKDHMKSYYIVVWNEQNSLKNYQKVTYDYFKKVHPGDTWDGKTTIPEEPLYDIYNSTKDDKW